MTAREYMAKKLQYLRKRNGLTVNEVGEAVGKSDKTVSAWEVGRGQPDADMLVALCKLFGVRISDFFVPEVSGEHTLNESESSTGNQLSLVTVSASTCGFMFQLYLF